MAVLVIYPVLQWQVLGAYRHRDNIQIGEEVMNVRNVKTVCICMPQERIDELKQTAASLGLSVSALVNLRLKYYDNQQQYRANKAQLSGIYGMVVDNEEVLEYAETDTGCVGPEE